MPRSLFHQFLAAIIAIAALSAALFAGGAWIIMGRLYEVENERAFAASAMALAAALPREAAESEVGAWCAEVASASAYRLTLIAPDGRVLADTMADPATMENHAARPEVAKALNGLTTTSHRRSATVGKELFYAATPVHAAARIVAVLRIAADLPAIEARLAPARWLLLAYVILVALAAVLAAALFSRRVASPLAALAEAARAVAAGERSRPIPQVSAPEEVAVLAAGLEAMSTELARRVREAEADGRERTAILDSMAEAVLALDSELRVRVANPAAAALFGFARPEDLMGLPLLEATRSTNLDAASESCRASGAPLEVEIAFYRETERWFQAFVAPLSMAGDGGTTPFDGGAAPVFDGEVIVLNDITRLRRLERIRQDFVANVSHELRTPIQLIKGFTEALLDGAASDPDQSSRFLSIMERNASRMENLIGDLLTLARLEQEESDWLKCEDLDIGALIDEAREAVEPKAHAKAIHVATTCEEGLRARVNGGLFVQAIVNLLDNAVKYSPAGSETRVEAKRLAHSPEGADQSGPWFEVSVADEGIGIPAKDLPRIFERFYRVDKARSRELGGTGLGLAIVRHVALAHGGRVAVESFEGEGSRFSIALPVRGPGSD